MDKSFLSKLYESGLGAKYDECCKSILAEKIILAWIIELFDNPPIVSIKLPTSVANLIR